jgi:hypothetical protein
MKIALVSDGDHQACCPAVRLYRQIEGDAWNDTALIHWYSLNRRTESLVLTGRYRFHVTGVDGVAASPEALVEMLCIVVS